MSLDKDSWINNTKTISKEFIENNYSNEISFFDTFWQVFSKKISEAIKFNGSGQLKLEPVDKILKEVSFSQGYTHDFVSPVVALIVAEVLHELNTNRYSQSKMKNIIHSAATRHRAKPSLTACLVKGLPTLCKDIIACKDDDASEAIVNESILLSQYRVWTEGRDYICKNIEKYEKKKHQYLFWIDLDAKKHIAPQSPEISLDPKAVQLLQYLIDNIGNRVQIPSVINDIYRTSSYKIEQEYGKIAQHITQLNNFCKNKDKFDDYLFANWRHEGLGLNDDFKEKYFLFKRVSQDTN